MKRLFHSIGRILQAFTKSQKAVAAVEFAIILPVALLLYVGAAQVTDGVTTSRKVTDVTRTLVDLLSHQSTSAQTISTPTPPNATSATTLASLLNSAQTLLYPEPLSTLTMTLTAIDVTNTALGVCCNATVRWSFTQGGTLRPCNVQLIGAAGPTMSLSNLPTQLLPVGTPLPQAVSYLIADVAYTYQPVFSSNLLSFVPTMQRTEYMMPRAIGQVVTGPLPASGTQYGQVCY